MLMLALCVKRCFYKNAFRSRRVAPSLREVNRVNPLVDQSKARKNRDVFAMPPVTDRSLIAGAKVLGRCADPSLDGAGQPLKGFSRALVQPTTSGGFDCRRGYRKARSGKELPKGAGCETSWSSAPCATMRANISLISGRAGGAISSQCELGAIRATAHIATPIGCSRFSVMTSAITGSYHSTNPTTRTCLDTARLRPPRLRTIQPCSSSWRSRLRRTDARGQGGGA